MIIAIEVDDDLLNRISHHARKRDITMEQYVYESVVTDIIRADENKGV